MVGVQDSAGPSAGAGTDANGGDEGDKTSRAISEEKLDTADPV